MTLQKLGRSSMVDLEKYATRRMCTWDVWISKMREPLVREYILEFFSHKALDRPSTFKFQFEGVPINSYRSMQAFISIMSLHLLKDMGDESFMDYYKKGATTNPKKETVEA
ncbi:hypothetical protein Tco_0078205 [Tanacetum coccineum]